MKKKILLMVMLLIVAMGSVSAYAADQKTEEKLYYQVLADCKKNTQESLQEVLRLLEPMPKIKNQRIQLALYNLRSAAYLGLKDHAHAVEDANVVLATNPDDFPAHNMRMIALTHSGRDEEAMPDINWLIVNRPVASAMYYYERSRVHLIAKRLDEAVADAQKSLDINHDYDYPHYTLGAVAQEQGRYADAYREFNIFLMCHDGSNQYWVEQTKNKVAWLAKQLKKQKKVEQNNKD